MSTVSQFVSRFVRDSYLDELVALSVIPMRDLERAFAQYQRENSKAKVTAESFCAEYFYHNMHIDLVHNNDENEVCQDTPIHDFDYYDACSINQLNLIHA
jgi:hypothetical protein